ncbi:MAG: flagellar assembly protein FliW [Clostridium tyrobutyricum]|jgi:flagellar assembly factor FliW|uniref:flagellar assembly protein FliW n=1 Tax=Clostridium tyrobutyricum TaxID=1519 RepID=UPI00242E8046|nr:flagellar assembly protein FliW [Clostridium tyrobutyricum]MCH4199092.1 flagellar assembly protein FliW [Clostridium tyrobutyricum]MCH4259668.1 flagellar assembly protein FliW [Clostridium tyrobutyricum]MCI1240121.1 flagellar assembly protein FliW [Clostridium tyrobutyricum]MCI1651623.1 flagellar assembly protein FliW [Clostridium tyrobutyricum]MCI1938471.1 flagellar assembly protein FliW [Clostridium tyrobutyricum]
MELKTKFHGMINYDKKDVITFKKGIPGFENLKKFILVPAEENSLFGILQSTEDTDIGIVVASPFNVCENYEFDIDDDKISELNIKDNKDILIVNTVTLNSNIENITINLKAPIVINTKYNIGEQLILDNADYPIKYPLFKGEV